MEKYRNELESIRNIGSSGPLPPGPSGLGGGPGGIPRLPVGGPMAPMGIVGEDINGQSDRLSLLQQEANRRNIKGGAIKGGYGLKDESFKDAPKTQIMSDDKGRFFVGYKAMRNGKIQYVRGPEPGTGSSNPLEMLGRAINPNAYKQVDDISAKNKYQEASAGSISSLKARGASQLTLANRQSELKRYAPSAPSRPTPRVVYRQGAGTGGARTKSDLMGGATPKVPSFNALNGVVNCPSPNVEPPKF
jgi:hypothetical protein